MENNGKNSEFLQSAEWRTFQKKAGRKSYFIENEAPASSAGTFSASIIEHELPMVGKYLYCPKGPISNFQFPISNEFSKSNDQIKSGMRELVELAKKEHAGWIRIEPENDAALKIITENISEKIVKAPHDMQPKEVFVLDITKPAEQLLAEMKSKTRYNIGVAQKKGVVISQNIHHVDAFLKLTKEMAARQGIAAHPESYYRKMIESLPSDMLKIYVAEYEGTVIAANLMVFYGDTVTYLHGASSNEHRNVMAPYLLQWQAIRDAKDRGFVKYDFGGVKTSNIKHQTSDDWQGITNFKLGFSPETKPVVFPGSYDIIINPRKYAVYRGLQKIKSILNH